jgi:hypothetical protein
MAVAMLCQFGSQVVTLEVDRHQPNRRRYPAQSPTHDRLLAGNIHRQVDFEHRNLGSTAQVVRAGVQSCSEDYHGVDVGQCLVELFSDVPLATDQICPQPGTRPLRGSDHHAPKRS